MSDARKRAEEALAAYDRCKGYEADEYAMACIEPFRALLAEPAPACGSVSTVRSADPPAKPLPTCAACGSNFITPAPAADAVAAFGTRLLAEWWENDCADIDGATVQEIAEKTGLWHQVKRHADGVECEWCGNDGACGELTGAGLAALGERAASSRAGVPATDAVVEAAEEWAAAEAEYDATPAHSSDTDAFERNLFRMQSARRRLRAAIDARRRG